MIYSSPWINLLLLMAIKMVLCGAVAGADEAVNNTSRVRRAQNHHHRMLTDEELDATAIWKRSHWREMQSILRKEGSQKDVVECCPSVLEMVAKKGGRTPTGLYVELYEDGEHKQRLYELSCAPDVADRPCRFVDARLYNQSRCVQKYSYSYALVRYTSGVASPRPEGHFAVPGSGGWSMDYVIVRAGCECQLTPRRRVHRRRLERHRARTRTRHDNDNDP